MIQFKSLRLSGFKSFVDKTELEITCGLNGIVGPNGCGKSNLVEALRWVMGESSAKRRRGGGMEDVIFSGTSSRSARNIAEVSLLIDNSSRTAPSAYNNSDEIEIIRRIERDRGSAYKINGKNARARDVQMLFADTVTGAGSPALVSQGQVTKIINAKPLERRNILEESAGISGLYARRHEAELRLRAADANLLRIEDIVGSMEARLSALKRQARQASRYRNINAQIRQLELLIAYLEWQQLAERQVTTQNRFNAAESLVAEKLASVTQLTKTQNTQAQDLPPLRKKEMELAAALQTQKIALQRLEDEEQRLVQILQETKDQYEQAVTDGAHETNVMNESIQQIERMKEEQETLLSEQTKEGGKLEEKENSRAELETKVSELEEKYTALMQDAADERARKESLAGQIQQNEARLEIVTARLEKAQEDITDIKDSNKYSSAIEDISIKINDLIIKVNVIDGDVSAKQNAITNAQGDLNAKRANLNKIQQQEAEFGAEIKMLESFFNSEDAQNFSPVLDQVSADSGFEKALSRALGDSLMASLENDAPATWLKRSLDKLPALPDGATSLLPHIKAPEALHLALSQIGYIDNDTKGDALVHTLHPGQSLVSAQGSYWRWDGYCVKASATDRHSLHLEQKNKLLELEAKRPSIEALVNESKDALGSAITTHENAQKEYEALQGNLKETQMQLTALHQDLSAAKEQFVKIDSEKTRLQDTITLAQDDIKTLNETIASEKAKLATYDNQEQSKACENVEEVRATMMEAREAHQAATRAFDLYQQQQNTRKARLHAIADENISLKNRSIRARERSKELAIREEALKEKLKDLAQRPKDTATNREDLLNKISEMDAARAGANEKLNACENYFNETGKALKEAESILSSAREDRAGAQATLAGFQEQQDDMRRGIREQFDLSPNELSANLSVNPEDQETSQLDSLRTQREKLTRERENIGAVNLRADNEALELEKEVGGILHERNDLTQAIEELRGGIATINKEARERLLIAFEHVNAHFQSLFARLFGGGQAYLKLIDSDNALEAGLEIYAQPPGKALQAMSLMSGGEQTLAAIALIFAMFLTNPSPICVLDEIDAPLDDANVDRVCDLLEEIAERSETRFLIITHHRLTMARMDRLYGVTMSEKGVSQLVSVDLQESFNFLEAA